jgi:hypothetical protein
MASVVFTGSAKCAWGNAQGAADTVVSINNADGGGVASFNWGVPGDGTTLDNQFTCDGLGSDGGAWSAGMGEAFKIASFTYRNGSTFYGDLQSVDLLLGLAVGGASGYSGDFPYLMLTTNTPNETGDPVLDGDIVSIFGNGLTSGAFSFDGVDYTVRLLGFSTDGGQTLTEGFRSPEGANVSAGIYAQIQVQAVPEPGTLALVGCGVLCLLGSRRKSGRKLARKA